MKAHLPVALAVLGLGPLLLVACNRDEDCLDTHVGMRLGV